MMSGICNANILRSICRFGLVGIHLCQAAKNTFWLSPFEIPRELWQSHKMVPVLYSLMHMYKLQHFIIKKLTRNQMQKLNDNDT